MRILTRARWIAVGLVLGTIAALYAQEPAMFERGLSIVRGELAMSGAAGNTIAFEGSTADANETRFLVTDPTADRNFTFGNATNTIVSWTLTTPIITSPNITTEAVTASGATETLTSADCGQTTLLDTDAGSVVTLPAATGTGCTLRFIVTDGNGSNDHSLVVADNTDEFLGAIISIGTTADNSDAFTALASDNFDAIQMNGSTEGGLEGTWIVLQDVAANVWALSGVAISTDAAAIMIVSGVVE